MSTETRVQPDSAPVTELLTAPEVAAWLLCSPNTLRDWRFKGTGPKYFRLGKKIVYERADVQAWIEEQKLKTGSGTK